MASLETGTVTFKIGAENFGSAVCSENDFNINFLGQKSFQIVKGVKIY